MHPHKKPPQLLLDVGMRPSVICSITTDSPMRQEILFMSPESGIYQKMNFRMWLKTRNRRQEPSEPAGFRPDFSR
jgi:hypothetical protein